MGFPPTRLHDLARSLSPAIDPAIDSAWRDAISHAVTRVPSFAVVVFFNLVVTLVVAWIALTMHGTVPRETGGGVILALVVGQLGILGRIWARIAALATQASLRRLAAE
ncbi:MAG: hypothetical protein IT175_11755 [Acidobacteria bacterium]|nr:hypothetical protein [Acidobacteriota bacterium]